MRRLTTLDAIGAPRPAAATEDAIVHRTRVRFQEGKLSYRVRSLVGTLLLLCSLPTFAIAQNLHGFPLKPKTSYDGDDAACLNAVKMSDAGRAALAGSDEYQHLFPSSDSPAPTIPVLQAVDQYLADTKLEDASACKDSRGIDALDERFFLALEDLAIVKMSTFRQAYQDQLAQLRVMKEHGFATRHPVVYSKYVDRLQSEFDRENNAFRAP